MERSDDKDECAGGISESNHVELEAKGVGTGLLLQGQNGHEKV